MKKGTTGGKHTFLKVLAGTITAGSVLFTGAVALRQYRLNYRITLSDENLAHIEQVFDINSADEFRYFSYSGRDSEKGETVELETDDSKGSFPRTSTPLWNYAPQTTEDCSTITATAEVR